MDFFITAVFIFKLVFLGFLIFNYNLFAFVFKSEEFKKNQLTEFKNEFFEGEKKNIGSFSFVNEFNILRFLFKNCCRILNLVRNKGNFLLFFISKNKKVNWEKIEKHNIIIKDVKVSKRINDKFLIELFIKRKIKKKIFQLNFKFLKKKGFYPLPAIKEINNY